jgi:peptidase inhibitor I9
MYVRFTLSLMVLVVATACSHSPTAPSKPEPPLLAQQYQFACARWSPDVPPAGETFIDFRTTGEASATRPPNHVLAAITAAGGRIDHIYNAPMVRAIIEPSAAAMLVGNSFSGVAGSARTVTERARLDVSVIVMLTGAVTDADIANAEAIGARIVHRYTVINGYSAVIPDAAIPALRTLPGVQLVEADGVGCTAERSVN